jgi:hypothetical protein
MTVFFLFLSQYLFLLMRLANVMAFDGGSWMRLSRSGAVCDEMIPLSYCTRHMELMLVLYFHKTIKGHITLYAHSVKTNSESSGYPFDNI